MEILDNCKGMPHMRSPEGELRRQQKSEAKHIVHQYAYADGIRAERVNLLTPAEIIARLQITYPEILISVTQYEKGEVLVDSKGKGTLQQQEKRACMCICGYAHVSQ
jgi:hypothetical protein